MSQVETSRKQVKGVMGATLDKVPALSGALAGASRAAVRRMARLEEAFEQAELWPSAEPRPVRQAAGEPVAVAEPVSFVEVAPLRAPVAAKAAPRAAVRRVVPAPMPVAARNMPVQTIARFLNVNGAIEGMKSSGMRFDLPGRGLSHTLRLWRGTTETATYSTVPF